MRITVIGAGITGMSCAHELAEAGHDVTVVADHGPGDTVSALAAAIWFPYRSTFDDSSRLLERSLTRFVELAKLASGVTQGKQDTHCENGENRDNGDSDGAGSGESVDDFTDDIPPVELRRGTVIERVDHPDRSWTAPVTAVLGPDAVHDVNGGLATTLPMIMMPSYLAWLMDSCRISGVRFIWRRVDSLAALCTGENGKSGETAPDAVVLAGGLRGGELLGGDAEMTPVRGQVVVLANGDGNSLEAITDWITDDDNPAGPIYVLPRVDDVVVGGVAEVGATSEEPDEETSRSILARAEKLVPELAELPILGHGAGLRPVRSVLRLGLLNAEELPADVAATGVPIIAAYGHGGSGVTLSWGTAERVAEIVDTLPA